MQKYQELCEYLETVADQFDIEMDKGLKKTLEDLRGLYNCIYETVE